MANGATMQADIPEPEVLVERRQYPAIALWMGEPVFSRHLRSEWTGNLPAQPIRFDILQRVAEVLADLVGHEYPCADPAREQHCLGMAADRLREASDWLTKAARGGQELIERELCDGWSIDELLGMRDRNAEHGWRDGSQEHRAAAADRWEEYAERARENARRLREEPEPAGRAGK